VENGDPFSRLSAEARAERLADAGSLARLGRTGTSDSGVWVGACRIDGRDVLLALTDGHRRGGTIGVDDSARLTQWIAAAVGRRFEAVIVGWDTGGVRVEEGPVALATASAVGVALARLSIFGPPVITLVSGPRGCFGAPAVIAALSNWIVVIGEAHWGLTGPKLLEAGRVPATEELGLQATSGENRLRLGHANVLVEDSAGHVRAEIARRLAAPPRLARPARAMDLGLARTEERLHQLEGGRSKRGPMANRGVRQRDLLRFSFRGQWRPTGPRLERGLVHAAWGQLGQRAALGILVGEARRRELGIGIEEAHAITEMVRFAANRPGRERAPILIFVFCQGHAVDVEEERLGLHASLAETLRSLVAARELGHPLLCVLGGGAYGAAYLTLAAPSHRILAIRGTSVAPMAPKVLASFRRLKGLREGVERASDLAELIPDITIVNSIVRLPRALQEAVDEVVLSAGEERKAKRIVVAKDMR